MELCHWTDLTPQLKAALSGEESRGETVQAQAKQTEDE
eukprot:COSAG01_NODE_12259_length_1772_cov_2.410640_4_plen_37_part_01